MAPQNERVHDKRKDYLMEGKIEQGGNACVYAATRRIDGKPVAVKFIPNANLAGFTTPPPGILIPKEVSWLQRVAGIHGCIRMLDHFSLEKGHIIVMERPQSHVDLQEYVRRKPKNTVPEGEARMLFQQALLTLTELFHAGILHNDVKANNMLLDLDTYQVKIIDFGCATAVKAEGYTCFQSAEAYKPPEYILKKSYNALPYTVWSLGITLFFLTNGYHPFQSNQMILEGKLHFKDGVSADLKNLIESMLKINPSKRTDLPGIIFHPWMLQSLEEHVTE